MKIPRALTIAGSDSGGGAGIQADLKAFAAAGAHGMSAIVALTAQNTVGVTAVHEVPPEFVRAQLEAVFSDLGVDAAKTGMLFSRAVIETVSAFLREHRVPLVVDPVMVASSGATLLADDAVGALVSELFPLATVVTPNLMEAKALTGRDASRRELAERLHDLGAAAVSSPAGTAIPRSTISSTAASMSRFPLRGTGSRRRTVRVAHTRRRSPRCSRAA
jgi:hydroxymethylpyrimidine kinase/phosphomethylpyrimidine kinase